MQSVAIYLDLVKILAPIRASYLDKDDLTKALRLFAEGLRSPKICRYVREMESQSLCAFGLTTRQAAAAKDLLSRKTQIDIIMLCNAKSKMCSFDATTCNACSAIKEWDSPFTVIAGMNDTCSTAIGKYCMANPTSGMCFDPSKSTYTTLVCW
jgi:hypothetical protein